MPSKPSLCPALREASDATGSFSVSFPAGRGQIVVPVPGDGIRPSRPAHHVLRDGTNALRRALNMYTVTLSETTRPHLPAGLSACGPLSLPAGEGNMTEAAITSPPGRGRRGAAEPGEGGLVRGRGGRALPYCGVRASEAGTTRRCSGAAMRASQSPPLGSSARATRMYLRPSASTRALSACHWRQVPDLR